LAETSLLLLVSPLRLVLLVASHFLPPVLVRPAVLLTSRLELAALAVVAL
jgi:hypothetical protein